MTENILETIRKGVQDFVAPEVRQIKADLGSLGAKVEAMNSKFESKFDALHAEFDALRSEVRANQQSLMGHCSRFARRDGNAARN
jgi:hypothetical protein